MKRVLGVLCCGCLCSTYAIGMFTNEEAASSSRNPSQRVRVLNEEESSREGNDLEAITDSIKTFELPSGSKCPVKGIEYLQIILDQHQKRFETQLKDLSLKERYVNDESEKNPFVKAKQEEINNRDLIIEQNKATISYLEEKDVVNQQKINEQETTIRRQSEDLNGKDQEVSMLKRRADELEKQVLERDQQIREKDEKFVVVKRERDRYMEESKTYEKTFNMLEEAVNVYASSWAGEGDFKERYDSAKTFDEKMAVVMAHLLMHSARKEAVPQGRVLEIVRPEERSLNTIVDVSRHDFLLAPENEANSFPMGRYIYTGSVNTENKPDGEGKITDKNEVMKINGTFREGFLDITKPITFKGAGVSFKFEFPGEIAEEHRYLISFVDISEATCSFGVRTITLTSPENRVSFIFNRDYIYVGKLNKSGKPQGQGIRFHTNGSVKEGEFEEGHIVKEINSAKRKRLQ